MMQAMRAFNRSQDQVDLPPCAGSDCPGTLWWSDGEIVCTHCENC